MVSTRKVCTATIGGRVKSLLRQLDALDFGNVGDVVQSRTDGHRITLYSLDEAVCGPYRDSMAGSLALDREHLGADQDKVFEAVVMNVSAKIVDDITGGWEVGALGRKTKVREGG